MYSVVLMMALTGGAEATAFGGSGCHGCNGCSGAYAGCSGNSCHGHRLFGNRSHGCNGCQGYSCNGCSGNVSHCGCSGFFHRHHSCCGCTGGHACSGYSCNGGCVGAVAVPEAPPEAPKKNPEKVDPAPVKNGAMLPVAPATITVSIPANAKLTVNGVATRLTAATRVFLTPELASGKSFAYILQAEVVIDGKTVNLSKNVTVRAGEETKVSFVVPVTNVASK